MARRFVVLHIEDRDDDALLFKWALRKHAPEIEVRGVGKTEDAKRYLLGQPPYSDRIANPLPDLIISDLTLPGGSGFEFLQWRQEHGPCKNTPVVVLSNSDLTLDKRKATALGATQYYSKPLTFSDWQRMTQDLFSKWVPMSSSERALPSLANI